MATILYESPNLSIVRYIGSLDENGLPFTTWQINDQVAHGAIRLTFNQLSQLIRWIAENDVESMFQGPGIRDD